MEEASKVTPVQIQGKDLLSQLPKKPFFTAPSGLYKSFGLDAVVVLLAAIAGMMFARFLSGAEGAILPAIALGIFMAFSILGTLLVKNLGHRFLIIVPTGAAFILPLWDAPLQTLFICFGIMILLLCWGEYLSKEDAENSVEIRFFRATRRPLSKLITAVAIVAVIFQIPNWNKKNDFISKPVFNSIFNWSAKIAGGLYPEYKFNDNIDVFARSIAKSQLEKNINFSLLPGAIKTQSLNQASQKVAEDLSKIFGFELNAHNTFSEASYSFLTKSLLDLKQKFGSTFLTVWAIAIFLVWRSIGTIFGYFVSLLSFLIYHIMIAIGIIRVRTENKPHEIVEFF